ncbi:hypothetical protein E4T51_01227 [Aureobasidium sp. EXF-12344]|nr:hypothetical protein E4T51_01227 [Aureobasidium sp. EXF-12344]
MHRVVFSAGRSVNNASKISSSRTFASVSSASRNHKVVVVGGGSAGLAISHQLLRTGKFTQDDIAIVDPSAYHDYQPGWTLVGGGLKTKEELRKPMNSLVDSKLKLYNQGVNTFVPEENLVTLGNGDKVGYEHLVVAPGIGIKYDNIKGLPEALADQSAPVSTIYGYETCDKVFRNIKEFRGGEALFTLPTGVVKCAGAPQKAMWLALDHWKKAGLYDPSNVANSPIKISFATALPVMFGVPKYSATLEKLRQERGVEAMFQHDLVEINGDKAIFARLDGGEQVSKRFDLLHVVPKMGPHAFIKDSPLANAAGFVDVEDATLRHKKFANVWSAGDASSLPTAKTAAAVTSQAPVLVQNMLQAIEGKELNAAYDGYTSCPLLTEYGKVLLAEFKYGGQPKETFAKFGVDQAVPRRAFYHLKKDFFPWVYYNNMVKGTWGGPKGWLSAEKGMASQEQNSLESEDGISLLHEKILQQTRPRHTSNTKIQRMKPSSTAPAASNLSDMDERDTDEQHHVPSLVKHTTFHGFPLPIDLDGDTQPMPSQFYKNFTSCLGSEGDTQLDDETAPDTEQETPQIDLMQHWPQPTYHELSSDEDEEKDEGQYFLSSVARPTFPKTPATAGRKRTHRGDVVPSTTSTKTPGSGAMSAFAFGNAPLLNSTQLFHATQSPSSPIPNVPRSDPVLSRPSPNIRQSSPGQNLAFSSPLKGLVQSPSRSVNMAGRLSRPGTRDGLFQNNAAITNALENRGENEWEYHDREGVSLDDQVQDSPASDSMDEYDEFAQSIRFSQRQASSSPQPNRSDEENDEVDSSSRTSTHSSQHNLDVDMPHASVPSGREQSSHQLPTTQMLSRDADTTDYAVADSQPTRQEETQLPPPLVEPSSMSSFVPGSYPLSQTIQRLNGLKRDAAESSSIPKPPPLTSQVATQTQNRLPSSPPQLPAVTDELEEEEALNITNEARVGDNHTGVSSPLPDTRPAPSQRTKDLRENNHKQSSTVPDTDPADEIVSSNRHQEPAAGVTHDQQQAFSIGNGASPAISSIPQFEKHRATQLQSQSQAQNSVSSTESPRKAAGILNFADIATDPTPPSAGASKDLDLGIDILSNEDHDFMDLMTSPPAKKMRLYGKKARGLQRTRSKVDDKSPMKPQAVVESPVKSVLRTVTFHDHASPKKQQKPDVEDANNTADAPEQTKPVELTHTETASTIDPNSQPHEPVETPLDNLPEAIPGPSKDKAVTNLPDRSAETEQVEAAVDHGVQGEVRQLTPPDNNGQSTPPSARKREQAGASAATNARDTMLALKSVEVKTPINKGRLVRPKRRNSEQSPLRTPISRRQEAVKVPKSKLSHAQRLSPSDGPRQEKAIAPADSVIQAVTAQESTTTTTEHTDIATDASMTDVASEQNHGYDENTDAAAEITQPDRVLALFKGTGQAYYPATCLGAATLDGLKLRIRFDDGTITQLDSFLVRRLDLRRGDQVKVDLQGMRSKTYVVVGFQDKVENVEPESYPKTDVHGFDTLQLVVKDRDSVSAPNRISAAALLKVPVTNTYLTQTMWVRFEGRNYNSSTASMTTIATGHPSRPQTPVPQNNTLTTPASRSRRGTVTSIHTSTIPSVRSLARPEFASPLPAGRGIFSGMAFAVSYSADSPEKNRILEYIQSHGGLILDKGFDELFSVRDLGDAPEESRSPSSSATDDADALILSARAKTLGFVALIADKHSRRAKYVQALALSLPCLSGRWILDSIASGNVLPWTKYLLPAGESAFLSGAVRSRTLTPYVPTTVKLAQTIQDRERLLQGGRVLLVSAGAGGRKWEARRAYAFLTVALGASVVRRVSGLDSAKRILDAEEGWGWVYVEGTIEEAEKTLFRNGSVEDGGTAKKGRKRKREDDGQEKMVATRRDGKVRIVGDEFVVQSLILGDLMLHGATRDEVKEKSETSSHAYIQTTRLEILLSATADRAQKSKSHARLAQPKVPASKAF